MNTLKFKEEWFIVSNNLTDKQYREFFNKIAEYGFSEGFEDVRSDDPTVNAYLQMAKCSLIQSIRQ